VESKRGEAFGQLSFNVEERRLGLIEADDGLRGESRDLAAELRADGPRGARNHHDFALNALANGVLVDTGRLPAQQILNGPIANLSAQLAACAVDRPFGASFIARFRAGDEGHVHSMAALRAAIRETPRHVQL
jgi:hypothetical protein